MIHIVFSIHDQKADAFLPPFILPKEEMAKRTFYDCVNSEDHQFGAHPADYTLFKLGLFDDESGTYLLEKTPISLGSGIEYRRLPTESVNGNPEISNAASVQSDAASEDTSQ
jgi:hypothetical protein